MRCVATAQLTRTARTHPRAPEHSGPNRPGLCSPTTTPPPSGSGASARLTHGDVAGSHFDTPQSDHPILCLKSAALQALERTFLQFRAPQQTPWRTAMQREELLGEPPRKTARPVKIRSTPCRPRAARGVMEWLWNGEREPGGGYSAPLGGLASKMIFRLCTLRSS